MPKNPKLLSSRLDADFFQPLPRRHLSQVAPKASDYLETKGQATASLRRIIAIGGGLSWLILLLKQGIFSMDSVTEALLAGSSVAVLAVGVLNLKRAFVPTMGIAGIIYLVLVVVHAGQILFSGQSNLSELMLGDYAALPAGILVAAWPRWSSISISVLVGSMLSAAVNHRYGGGFALLIEALNAAVTTLPLNYIVMRVLRTAKKIDDGSQQAIKNARVLATQKALVELESRFLSFIHDKVLAQLNALRRGILPFSVENVRESYALNAPQLVYQFWPVSEVISRIQIAVREEYPAIAFDEDVIKQASFDIPAEAGSALIDAARQAAKNIAIHAPGSSAGLSIQVDREEESIDIRIRDDGPGFHTDNIPANRAGIPLSILARVNQLPGGQAEIKSAKGRGTEVILQWVELRDVGTTEVDEIPSVYETMGFAELYRPLPAFLLWCVFLGISLRVQPTNELLWAAGLALAGLGLAILIRGETERLSLDNSVLVMLCIWGFYVLAIASKASDIQRWPFNWYIPIALLMCLYLTVRYQPVIGIGSWLGCVIIGEIFGALGWQSPLLQWTTTLPLVFVILPGAILPMLVKQVSSGLPMLIASGRVKTARRAITEVEEEFVNNTRQWLAQRLGFMLRQGLDENAQKSAALLMELRLRDALRSPLFDTPAITTAVWDARIRGAQVRLVDDLSPSTEGPVQDPRLEVLNHKLLNELANLQDGDSLVVRVFPPVRSTFGVLRVERADSEDVVVEKFE